MILLIGDIWSSQIIEEEWWLQGAGRYGGSYLICEEFQLGQMEKEMATHSSILAWEIPWREESMGSQRVRDDLVTKQQQMGCSS